MDKNPRVFLTHILESVKAIEEYAKEKDFDAFLDSAKDQDAIIRRLEVIGEAVKNLREDFKQRHSDIPWNKIGGMRNVLIHEYFVVDTRAVWNTVNNDLPKLKSQITDLLNSANT